VLAASAELPLLVAAGRALDSIADGTLLLLDAGTSRLVVDPAPAVVDAARTRIAAARVRHGEQRERAGEACRTADGTRIELFANLASAEGAAEAVAAGAEGCGLLRTEFLFLDRQIAPSEDEQLEAYQAVADALDGRPLIVRTLDVGGDKPLAYLPLPPEDNPALGLRGIRVGLARPDLLDEQIRAILRVTPSGRCRIMVPMVSDVAELRAVRLRVNAIAAQLDLPERAELGVMIETPAAALLGDRLALEADFLSVGTNDLAQYALAIDRTNPALAAQADAFHPAVLRLIAIAAEAAARTGRPIGVCGGLASDPLAAPLLVGLGVTELSAVPAALGAVKARLLEITIEQCRALAERALQEDSAAAVRALLAASHSDAGH
jgi:phosphoenolpyruvate-protein phosphotransferase